jgi:hypothetical protein
MPRLFGIREFAKAFECHLRYWDLARSWRDTGGIGAFKLSGPNLSFHVDPRILNLKSTYLSPGFVESFRLMVRTLGICISFQLEGQWSVGRGGPPLDTVLVLPLLSRAVLFPWGIASFEPFIESAYGIFGAFARRLLCHLRVTFEKSIEMANFGCVLDDSESIFLSFEESGLTRDCASRGVETCTSLITFVLLTLSYTTDKSKVKVA